MEVNVRTVDEVTVIYLNGSLDASTAPIVQRRLEMILPDGGKVLLDLSEVQYVSSAGLRTLLMAYRHAERVGTALAVTGLSVHVRSILSATGFLRFFAVVDTTAEGLAALNEPAIDRPDTSTPKDESWLSTRQ